MPFKEFFHSFFGVKTGRYCSFSHFNLVNLGCPSQLTNLGEAVWSPPQPVPPPRPFYGPKMVKSAYPTSPTSEKAPQALFSANLHDHPSVPRTVELAEEYPLPGPQSQPPILDRDMLAAADQRTLAVRV